MSLSNLAQNAVKLVDANAFVTLRYRVTLPDGKDAVSTFGMNPATLMLGSGQLNENLERCLIGMQVGQRQAYVLEPEAGFGMKNPELVQRVSLSALPRALDEEIGDMVSFTDASGKEFAGVLVALDDSAATFDFNHPLAGKTVTFEAQIVGIT